MKFTRRKFLQFIGLESLLLTTSKRSALASPDEELKFIRNESLATIRQGFPGNPMIEGRFVNSDMGLSEHSFGAVQKWFISSNPQKEEKENEIYSVPVRDLPDQNSIKDDCIIWLGHASFLIQLDGKWLLTDPCLTAPPFRRRYSSLPIPIEQFKVD